MPITWPEPDVLLEAGEDGPARRAQRANRAAVDVVKQRHQAELTYTQKLQKRLATLKGSLSARLLSDPGSLTDFKRFTLTSLLADVDRLISETQAQVTKDAGTGLNDMATLGEQAADEPMKAAQLTIRPGLPGLDSTVVQVTYEQLVDLLTQPMQQFGTDVKVALRRVALAGDNKFEEIQRLRDKISGAGFDNAQFRAERIIRTELGRVFNEATYSRLVQLAADFRFLRKGWRATKDGRTRIGHREAGELYARGQGVPLVQRFRVNVYDERGKASGKAPKFMGVASLRFPVDPQGQPQGQLSAGATIMCRCNAFVDFDMAEFEAYTKAKVAQAVGRPAPPTPPPAPPKPPVIPKAPIPVPKPTPTPKPKPAPKPKPVPKPKATPPAQIPTAAQVMPAATVKAAGTPISGKLAIQAGKAWDWARDVLANIDRVNGDGTLGLIPLLKSKARKFFGQFTYDWSRQGVKIEISGGGMKNHPRMTLTHEVGHWIDTTGAGHSISHAGTYTTTTQAWISGKTPQIDAAILKVRRAMQNSQALQTLAKWGRSSKANTGAWKITPQGMVQTGASPAAGGNGYEGDGTIPRGINRRHISYLLRNEECWARAYAQYVAVTGTDPIHLAELRLMQSNMATGPVAATTPFHFPTAGKPLPATSWNYPSQWSDADFEPIKAAIDDLLKELGWRK